MLRSVARQRNAALLIGAPVSFLHVTPGTRGGGEPRSRICGAPFRFASRCAAPGTREGNKLGEIAGSPSLFSQPLLTTISHSNRCGHVKLFI